MIKNFFNINIYLLIFHASFLSFLASRFLAVYILESVDASIFLFPRTIVTPFNLTFFVSFSNIRFCFLTEYNKFPFNFQEKETALLVFSTLFS